jgi:hypothetical protein
MISRFGLAAALYVIAPAGLQAQKSYGSQIDASFAVPTGKFAQAFSAGWGISGLMFYDFEESFRMTLGGGYTRWDVDSDGVNEEYQAGGGTGTASASGHAAAIPIMLGLQLITPGPVRIFGLAEAGIMITKVEFAATVTTPGGGSSPADETNSTITEPAFILGGGGLMPIGETTSLGLTARYHFVKDSQYAYATNLTATTSQYLSISVGLNYHFPVQ